MASQRVCSSKQQKIHYFYSTVRCKGHFDYHDSMFDSVLLWRRFNGGEWQFVLIITY